MNQYCLLFKTGDSEIRALEKLEALERKKMFPLIELTRGRKSRNDAVGQVEKRLKSIRSLFISSSIILDLTSDPNLLNEEILSLYDATEGYSRWCDFVKNERDNHNYESVIPSILFNYNDDNFEMNLVRQVESLNATFGSMMFRSSIGDESFYSDLNMINDSINRCSEFYFVIDCEYLPMGVIESYQNRIEYRIEQVKKIVPNAIFIIAATSFPNNISDIGGKESDSFRLNEVELFSRISLTNPDVIYGDYGCINPIRNDEVVMSRGWVPRIDIPLKNSFFYYRRKRGSIRAYSDAYREVARLVVADSEFPKTLNCWGIQCVLDTAELLVRGSSPSFWISVRMNIHICQQISRLGL